MDHVYAHLLEGSKLLNHWIYKRNTKTNPEESQIAHFLTVAETCDIDFVFKINKT